MQREATNQKVYKHITKIPMQVIDCTISIQIKIIIKNCSKPYKDNQSNRKTSKGRMW